MHRFVGLLADGEKTFLYAREGGQLKKTRQVLWGDWLRIAPDQAAADDGYLTVLWAQKDDEQGNPQPPLEYFIPEDHTAETRPLEMIFLDVGQGDSSVLISPERGANERVMIIDAGIGDNLDRFLNWRFKYKDKGFAVHSLIITHPDEDHYGGFQPIFEAGTLKAQWLYHNGLLEQRAPTSGSSLRLGETEKDSTNNKTYHTQLLETNEQMRDFYGDVGDFGDMPYPKLMRTAINNEVVEEFAMMSNAHGTQENSRCWLPGFEPSGSAGFTIEVLGPIVEPDEQNHARLRRLGDNGKTKNGHSVLLRLQFGGMSILFGGDLNTQSEKLILQHYAGMKSWPKDNETRALLVNSAKTRLRSDVLKVCHHGASDVTDEFLQAVDPAAFIVSSGDEEGHVHPRPDLLGRLGRNGRGFAPLILSTELQRSTREREDEKDKDRIQKEAQKLSELKDDREASDVKRKKSLKTIEEAVNRLSRRNVEVYGAIHVKTDGDRLIVAFRIESSGDTAGKGKGKTKLWHYYEYTQDVNGTLVALHEVAP